MMSPAIALEKELAQKIYTSLQGDVVNDVLKKLENSGSDAWWKSKMEGHSLKVDKDLLPDMWELCTSLQKSLGFSFPFGLPEGNRGWRWLRAESGLHKLKNAAVRDPVRCNSFIDMMLSCI